MGTGDGGLDLVGMLHYALMLALILCFYAAIRLLQRIFDGQNGPNGHRVSLLGLLCLAAAAVAGCQATLSWKSPGTNPNQQIAPAIDTPAQGEEGIRDEG